MAEKTSGSTILTSVDSFARAMLDAADLDDDGIYDSVDNCTLVPNRKQKESDGDGYGDYCDADYNNDGIVDLIDSKMFVAE